MGEWSVRVRVRVRVRVTVRVRVRWVNGLLVGYGCKLELVG